MFSFGLQAQTTFNVDMTCAPAGFTDVFVTGPWCGWCANDTYNTMTDDDGDGIYSVTVADLTGTVEYKYAINGFADQENLINDMVDGATCAPVTDYAGYANRQIEADGTANDSYGTCDGTCNDGVAPPSSDVDVTFQVDMNDYTGSYGAVNLNGSFTGWCGACVEMTDADGDGVYNVTVALAPGTYEYKFTLDGWTAQEEFMPDAQPCTSTIDGFTNRSVEVVDATTLGVVCYNSCDACTGEGGGVDPVENVDVTFNVNMSNETVDPAGVYLAGGTFFGWPGDNLMSDEDGDGTWSITMSIPVGTSSNYTFLNGNCGDWSCKEDLTGQACADPNNYNDRTIVVAGAMTVSTCFGECTEDGSCPAPPSVFHDVTFHVNMENETLSAEGLFLAGGALFGFPGDFPMTDADGDNVYSITVSVPDGYTGDYTFVNGPDWWAKEDISGQDCAVPPYSDRRLTDITEDTVINTCFGFCTTDGSCGTPEPTAMVTFQVNMASYAGTYGAVNLNGSFNGWCGSCNPMEDADGDGIYDLTIALPLDTLEYKFTVDGWNDQENFEEGESCTTTIDGYTNRSLIVTEDVTLDAVCWNSCSVECEGASSNEYSVTFRVDMNEQTTNPIGVFVAGNFQGWTAGATAMSDDDGDDIWEYTAMLAEGQAVEYKFINGPNWGLDEAIPVACAVNNNRAFTVGAEDAVLDAVCFGACLPCGSSLPTEEVTFTVLTDNIEVAADGMHIAGALNGWSGEPMNDNGDGSWSITLSLEAATYEYKFQNGLDGWEELECGGNRSVVVELGAPVSVQGCFAQCSDVCSVDPDPADVTFQVDASQIEVSADGMFLMGSFTEPAWQFGAIAMNDDDGDGIWTATANISGAATFAYKFNNGAPVVEDVAVYDGEESGDFAAQGCGVDNGVGGFNRTHERSGMAETLDVVCFNSCSACGAGVTFNVDVTCAPAFDNLFVTGPWCGWCANDDYNTMTDPDGDGIYSVTISDLTGTVEYKYAINEFADQENLVNDMVDGASCAPITDFNGYANRTVEAGSSTNDYYGTCDGTCNDEVAAVGGTVLFQVDMSEYAGSYSQVNLNGSFNGWCGSCAVMTDDNADGIYELAVELAADTIEYKFTVDGWSAQEEFAEGTACTSTIDGYTNRSYIVTGDATLDVVCWNSCAACDGSGNGGGGDDMVSLTFNVNTSNIEVGPNGIYLGGGVFGDAQAHAMSDDDNDGVWTVTLDVASGLSGNYIFLNSPNDGGDWGAKENLAGLECSDPANFDDRILAPVTEDTVLSTCFGQCSTDGSCEAPPATYDVTFRVDMSTYEAGYGTVNLNGSFNGWCGGCTEMTDNDGDMVYEVTVALAEGTFEYKFTLDAWTAQEEFDGSEACVSTIDGFNNRSLDVAGEAVLDVVCWNSCEACVIVPEVLGCTNPEFLEYDPYATADDGSCSNLLVPGCMYESATNYNPLANDDDNSCEFEEGGNNDCPADLDGDGSVTTSDLLSFLAEFGASCS